MNEFYTVETRHARRQHRCCECGRTIEKGESYQRVTGEWEEKIRIYKTCQRCLDGQQPLAGLKKSFGSQRFSILSELLNSPCRPPKIFSQT